LASEKATARAIFDRYDHELPFVHQLADLCRRQAARHGHLELYDGAKRHWNSWEMLGVTWTKGAAPCSREEAERRMKDPDHPWFGRFKRRRAECHKAMNSLIQGSAARHTKLWMRECWRAGIVPLLQMHDCLDLSVGAPEVAERVTQMACDVVQLTVPMRVDLKFGRNWADAKHTWEELHAPQTPESAIPKDTPQAPESKDSTVSIAPAKAFSFNGCATKPPSVDGIEVPVEEHEEESLEARIKRIPLPDLIGEKLVNGKMHCPFHDDWIPSLHVYSDHWYCFQCGAHGDAVTWLVDIEGLTREAALEELLNWKGRVLRPGQKEKADQRALEFALALWKVARPIAGTLAERYLAEVRGIDIGALPTEAPLRFHPRCPFGPGERLPCLVALFQDVATDEPAGIHRMAVTPDVFNGERAAEDVRALADGARSQAVASQQAAFISWRRNRNGTRGRDPIAIPRGPDAPGVGSMFLHQHREISGAVEHPGALSAGRSRRKRRGLR
jgi:hypothetical protein